MVLWIAKHGLVHPDAVLEPYDTRLGTNHWTSPLIHAWCDQVQEQLTAELAGLENVTLTVLAGEQYRYAVYNSPWPHEIPMKGMGIGQQLGWLTAQLAVLSTRAEATANPPPAATRVDGRTGVPEVV